MNVITFYSQNIRSMANFNELSIHLESNIKTPIGLLAVQEVWSTKNRNTLINGFHKPYIVSRQYKDGGGVGLWINKAISFSVLDHLHLVQGVIQAKEATLIGLKQ